MNTFQIKASRWIVKNSHFFDPSLGETKESIEKRMKAFIELIYMDLMFSGESIFPKKENIEVQMFIDNVLDKNNLIDTALFSKSILGALCSIQQYNPTQRNFEVISQSVGHKFDLLARRVPYRKLDVKKALEIVNIKSNLPEYENLYAQTILGQNINYLLTNENITYSITHTLFYLTNMGTHLESFIDKKNTKKILLTLLEFYILKSNLDILGEVVLCIYFLGIDELSNLEKQAVGVAFNLIKNGQQKSGFIRGPFYDTHENEEVTFFNNYHTTLVSLGVNHVIQRSN